MGRQQTDEEETTEVEEKRKQENSEDEAPPAKKPRRTQDIRELLTCRDKSKHREQEQDQDIGEAEKTPPTPTPTVHYGQKEDLELTDWEEKFKSHIEETKRLEKEREDRIERQKSKNKAGNY